MGANAVTTVPVYVAGEVLTAADLNITNSGIPVFATTVTRDAAFGGTGEKTLAQGQTCYIEATSTYQTYNGSSWVSLVTAPGLVLVKTQTIGTAVASVTVSDAFSATYDNYLITVTGGAGSTAENVGLQFGATATGYYTSVFSVNYSSGSLTGARNNNATSLTFAGYMNANGIMFNVSVTNPFLAKNTGYSGAYMAIDTAGGSGTYAGFLNNTTSYTAFTLIPVGTLTGGTIRVYGYANS
jgi:hypothetical protein